MRFYRCVGIALSTGIALGACSGAGTSPAQAPAARSTPGKTSSGTARATISIVVPLKGRTTAARRRPGYVSPNTQSFGVTVLTNEDLPYSGTTAYINVSATSPNCTSDGTELTCTGAFDPPIGVDTFSVIAYAGANGSGATLSQDDSVSATILPLDYNVISMTLDPVAAAVTVTTATVQGDLATQPVPGSSQTVPVTVSAQDCTGATIVGPGDYVDPITLTLTEFPSLGATSLSETTVTSPSDAVTLSWNGAAGTQYATIAPSVTADVEGCKNAAGGVKGYFLPHPEPPYVWVAANGSGAAALVAYPTAWLQEIASSTTATRPGVEIELAGDVLTSVSVDGSNAIYGGYSSGSGGTSYAVDRYAPSATFTDAPSNVLPLSELEPAGVSNTSAPGIDTIAADPSGSVFDTFGSGDDAGIEKVAAPYSSGTEFFSNAGNNGNQFATPATLVVDGSDDVFLASQTYAANGDATISVVSAGSGPADIASTDIGPGNAVLGLAVVGTDLVAAIATSDDSETTPYPSFVEYSIAALKAGNASPTGLFSATASALPGSQECTVSNCLAIDGQGYYYLATTGSTFFVFSPSSSGANVMPIGAVTTGFDPTTSNDRIAVPSGEIAPPAGAPIAGIAAAPVSSSTLERIRAARIVEKAVGR